MCILRLFKCQGKQNFPWEPQDLQDFQDQHQKQQQKQKQNENQNPAVQLAAGALCCRRDTLYVYKRRQTYFLSTRINFAFQIYIFKLSNHGEAVARKGALSPSLRKLNSIFKAPTTTYTHPHTHLRRTWKGEERQGSCSCSSVSARCCMQALSYRLYCLSHT